MISRVDRCAECDYTYDDLPLADVPATLPRYATSYRRLLTSAPPDQLRRRPAPDVWSPLEYGCHVRDVLRVQHARLEQALTSDQPTFAPMDREGRVVRDRYNQQDPHAVAAELVDAATALARDFAALDDAGWERIAVYNWPTPAVRTMAWVARHTVHECRHHLMDIERGLRRADAHNGGGEYPGKMT